VRGTRAGPPAIERGPSRGPDDIGINRSEQQRTPSRVSRQPRRSKAPTAASPFKRRAQLRKFLQRLIDGPIINSGRLNKGSDILAAFVKLGGAPPVQARGRL
jgi:hypothetical protein